MTRFCDGCALGAVLMMTDVSRLKTNNGHSTDSDSDIELIGLGDLPGFV